MTDARVIPDAAGSVGERARNVAGPGAVVSHKLHACLPQYREPLRCGMQRDEVGAFPGSCRFHVTSMPRPVAGYAAIKTDKPARRAVSHGA